MNSTDTAPMTGGIWLSWFRGRHIAGHNCPAVLHLLYQVRYTIPFCHVVRTTTVLVRRPCRRARDFTMPLAKTTTRLDSQQQQHKNPITLRLYKVLGTNYSDDATREALQTLSDLYYTPTQPSGQREKDADEEDDMEHAGGQFSRTKVPRTDDSFRESVVGESAAKARKHLRRDMENKLAQGSREFVTLFAQVDQVCVVTCRLFSFCLRS